MRNKAKNRAGALRRYYQHRNDPAYKARARATSEAWKAAHPERYKALKDDWYQRNKARLSAQGKRSRAAKTKDKPKRVPFTEAEKRLRAKERVRKFRRKHREEINALRREQWKDPEVRRKWYEARERRFRENPEFLIKHRLRSRLKHALNGQLKAAKTMELIGCSACEFRRHIEAQWKPGMSWSNLGAGVGTWQIDHIKPIDQHDLSTVEGQKAAFHYSNTQPLWYEEHLKKSASEETGWRNQLEDAGKISDTPTVSAIAPATPISVPQPAQPQAPGN